MPIRRGEDWERPGELKVGAPVAESDAAVGRCVEAGATQLRVVAGDLARTLGTAGRDDRATSMLVGVDLLEVSLDGGDPSLVAAHVTAGRGWPLPPLAIMNAAFIGSANVAPRAHPGDGRVDVVRCRLGPADRLKAWRRLPTGAHVPHPQIEIRSVSELVENFVRPTPIRLDGTAVGKVSSLRVRVLPERVVIGV